MAATLYPTLKDQLQNLVAAISSSRSFSAPYPPFLPQISDQDLRPRLQNLWDAVHGNEGTSAGPKVDLVRSILDLVGRDLTVGAVASGELPEPLEDDSEEKHCRFQTALHDRLDVILTFYEIVYESLQNTRTLEPGAVFVPIIEELVELISVSSWHTLWSYIESRSKRFTIGMPASQGKALPLLRTINAFLRFLPKTPADLVFRGRVHHFASSVISIADKSAINMRGVYGNVKTTWDEDDKEETKEEANDGDVEMDSVEGKKEETVSAESRPDFYPTLWSLQQYFASPPSLDGPSTGEPPQNPFETFKNKSDFVLPILFEQTVKEKEMMGKEAEIVGKKRKRVESDDGGFFHPRYLTGKNLLHHELADPSFRRQILVQYFILFQFLLNLVPASVGKQSYTGGMPKTFVIDSENEIWIKTKINLIRGELQKMVPDGQRFTAAVTSLIFREKHYAQWKNDSCPESVFEIPPMHPQSASDAADLWKRRLEKPSKYPFKVGSRPLSKLWNRGFTNLDQLKGWKRSTTVEQLDQEIKTIEVDEEDDRAMGREPSAEVVAQNAQKKTILAWRALRHCAGSDLKHFAALQAKRDVHALLKSIRAAQEASLQVKAEHAGEGTDEEGDLEEKDGDAVKTEKTVVEAVETTTA
ncbi:THO complex subunit 1, partial [Tremellales sp. Uapishka_1]